MTILGVSFGCSSTGNPGDPLWSNLELILNVGGLPAVIMLFGYLYLRSVQKQTGNQIREMQAQVVEMQKQVGRQQDIMVTALNNNTSALSKLGTAMMLGCPLIRSQLLGDEGKGVFNGTQGPGESPRSG